jgi:protein-tyrosine phosphatase
VDVAPPGTYWVEHGRLLAGPYPRDLEAIGRAGVTLLLDLTRPGEEPPYEGVRTVRMSVDDFDHPTGPAMTAMLDAIDAELEAGGVVYVHCRGGLGRTGTVVGCWLVRHGTPAGAAVAAIARLRAGLPNASRRSPETDEQRAFVETWRRVPRSRDVRTNRRS